MNVHIKTFLSIFLFISFSARAQNDTLILQDLELDKVAPAGFAELNIPSSGSLLQGFIYKANGAGKHPTLLLLHGYPGNERNLDLAQVVRSHGWNVVYFDYRGSWASQGTFSFQHCVEDVVNAVGFCKKYTDSLHIDTSNIVLFGHSMGGWVCLQALKRLPDIKKGFALSTWDIYDNVKESTAAKQMHKIEREADHYFVLNKKSGKDLFAPVLTNPSFFDLKLAGPALSGKQIIMLDEHTLNRRIAEAIKKDNRSYFDYQVWATDHPFTNKRVSLMKMVLAFLDK